MAKLSPHTRERIKHNQRQVYVVIAKLRDCPDKIYMDLCTQCLRKRIKAAVKLPWNRSIKPYNVHNRMPPEYYAVTRDWPLAFWRTASAFEDTSSLKCQDCGWTAKGKGSL